MTTPYTPPKAHHVPKTMSARLQVAQDIATLAVFAACVCAAGWVGTFLQLRAELTHSCEVASAQ